MIQSFAQSLGPWGWWVLGFALLAAEVVSPGVFLVWIGLAAIALGALSLLFWDTAFWVWELQLALFALFSVAFVLIGRRLFAASATTTDEPFLNRREASLVGRTAILDQPIAEGRGRIRLDDTTWTVEGPDLPVGARVRIVAGTGRNLTVEAA